MVRSYVNMNTKSAALVSLMLALLPLCLASTTKVCCHSFCSKVGINNSHSSWDKKSFITLHFVSSLFLACFLWMVLSVAFELHYDMSCWLCSLWFHQSSVSHSWPVRPPLRCGGRPHAGPPTPLTHQVRSKVQQPIACQYQMYHEADNGCCQCGISLPNALLHALRSSDACATVLELCVATKVFLHASVASGEVSLPVHLPSICWQVLYP